MQRLLALAAVLAAGCRLDPLVDDQPGASANILPSTANIPSVSTNSELTNQITLNDSLDDDALDASGGVIVRSDGAFSGDGTPVRFWAFGGAERAPAPIYVFGTGDPTSSSFQQLTDHPPLVDTVPGDGEYEPIHTIFRVRVTDKYQGERITTSGALADAIDLALVEPPVAIKAFVNWPIVRPGTRLEVATGVSIAPTPLYAHGYVVDSFPLGGPRGVQPNPTGLLPTSQVSFVRAQGQPSYDAAHPIFQANIPTAPAQMKANYTPLSIVVDVDLAPIAGVINDDGDLFMRSPTNGAIIGTTTNVLSFTVTNKSLDLQIQFEDGMP